ncbi:MAG: extracellular solute-binding protein [Kiritimatiellae bacterium]|nr:extracellular solute-binding protein [Kiritimatiellia bacterium]
MKLINNIFTAMLAAGVTTCALAESVFPPPEWRETPDPIASPFAEKGGTLRFAASQPPKSFNYYIDNTTYVQLLFSMMYETLLSTDPLTTEFVPKLACRWSISDDKLVYTFRIDPEARWSDGMPVTATDVKWTFDQVMDPKNPTGAFKVMLGEFASPEIVDSKTVRFTARTTHWRNLLALGSFEIMPEHAFKEQEFSKLELANAVVSGPYTMDLVKEQISTRMRRREDWWAAERPASRNTMNFDYVVFKYYSSQENAFESFKKDGVDVYAVYTARLWANETVGERFSKNWIVKQRVSNYDPVGFQGFALNTRKFPFDDLRVRKAFAHLIDRETMNRTMMFDAYFLHRSYYEDLYDQEHPCPNPFFEFDVEKAKALLKEAGYVMNQQTGILEKGGRELTFDFLTRDSTSDKFLVVVDNALKQVGIKMNLVRKDFAAWMRDVDVFNFNATWASWSASRFRDPEQTWHSREAARNSSNNISGFSDERVDALIERQRTIFDLDERNQICREIDSILTQNVPYVLLWNINCVRLLYWNKLGTPPTILGKFSDERSLIAYWWYDRESAAELKTAIKNGTFLPRQPEEIDFDSFFQQQTNK